MDLRHDSAMARTGAIIAEKDLPRCACIGHDDSACALLRTSVESAVQSALVPRSLADSSRIHLCSARDNPGDRDSRSEQAGSQGPRARQLPARGPHRQGRNGRSVPGETSAAGRPAAVKLISPVALRASSPEQNRIVIERFRREAQAAATLRSPHTIELYDYGIAEDGTFYYVMELLDGINFQELVQKHGPLPAERVAHLLIQACDSLGEAHLAGLVHRDVKPSNLLACRMGLNVDFVKVVDFGLVKNDPDHATSGSDITAEGSVSGTPAFMAPESVSGMDSVGPPADVYALGCVAYWLLTGQNVFKAANPTMMLLQHVQASPVPPSLKAPKPVPRDLEDIVMRCLSKAPEDRPPNAAELAGLLVKSRTAVSWTDARAGGWWTSHHEARLDTVRSSVAASTDS